VDNRTRWGPPAGPGAIPQLHRYLALFGCVLVRHAGWVGVKGAHVGKVPPWLWQRIAQQEHRLRVLLRDAPRPGRGRG
jgi:hypothetical protein